MSDRSNPYFQQEVTHGEVDQWHDDFENADHEQFDDTGLWGIQDDYPFSITEQAVPDLTVKVSDGRAFSDDGKRIDHLGGTDNVDCSQDYLAAPTIVAVGGQENALSVYIRQIKTDSDPRVDGDAVPLFYRQTEDYEFRVRQSGAGAPPQAFPGLVAGEIKIMEVMLYNLTTQIFNEGTGGGPPTTDIDTTNREVGGSKIYKANQDSNRISIGGGAGFSSTTAGVADFDQSGGAVVNSMGASKQTATAIPAAMRYPLTRLPEFKGIIENVRVIVQQATANNIVVELRSTLDGAGFASEGGPWNTGLGAPGAFTFNQALAVVIDPLREYFLVVTCLGIADVVTKVEFIFSGRRCLP